MNDLGAWNAYDEVGGLITFLARSGDTGAIEALRQEVHTAPVEVRLAVVKVFWPGPRNGGESSSGPGVHVEADIPDLSAGEVGTAVERLLVDALDDTAKRVGLQGNYDKTSYKDPRICDMAALVLARRWPAKYQFDWSTDSTDCDAQIAVIRNHWLSEQGLPRNHD